MTTFFYLNVAMYGFATLDDICAAVFRDARMPDVILLAEHVFAVQAGGRVVNGVAYTSPDGTRGGADGHVTAALVRTDLVASCETVWLAGSDTRCATLVAIGGRRVAVCHLYGGRYEDVFYESNVHTRSEQIADMIARLNPDVVVGDFNSVAASANCPALSALFVDHPCNTRPDVFARYITDGHAVMGVQGFTRLTPNDVSTCSFGKPVDYIYDRAGAVKRFVEIDAMSARLSDHNGFSFIIQ